MAVITLKTVMDRLLYMEGKLDHISNRMRFQMAVIDDIQAQLDDVFKKASANTDALDSVVIAFDGLKTTIDGLNTKVTELQDQINSGQAVSLAPISAGLTAVSTKLDEMAQKESVLVNTGTV